MQVFSNILQRGIALLSSFFICLGISVSVFAQTTPATQRTQIKQQTSGQISTPPPPSGKKSTSTAASTVSMAKIGELMITCNEINRNLATGESELIGDVQIIYKDQHLSADKVIIDQNKKTAFLTGKVVIKNTLYEIGGEAIDLNYETSSSKIHNGYVKSNNILFTGKLIEQKDGKDFFVVDANYTTCSNCPASWSFDGSKIDAQLGGYAFIKNTFIKVSGIPVFWLPYLVVPLKNERQTGLLPPEIGYIPKRRTFYSQSLFIALSEWHDTTLNFKTYEIGGLKKTIEYRYALNEKSFGDFSLSHIKDTLTLPRLRIASTNTTAGACVETISFNGVNSIS
jgi:LPS-assembly protein